MYMYHECGYPLLIESVSQGNKFLVECFDPKIKDHAAKVIQCPCCGKWLGKLSPSDQLNLLKEQFSVNMNMSV